METCPTTKPSGPAGGTYTATQQMAIGLRVVKQSPITAGFQAGQTIPYLLERVYAGGNTPFLMNTAARGRYGLLVELTAGYPDSYGTVLQTEVTCSICRALFEAFSQPVK